MSAHGEHRPITEKGTLRRVSVSILVNNFEEANKKIKFVKDSEKL
jgi:hypothetical protein